MENEIKKEVRFNKYPFFLWITYKKLVTLYDKNTKVRSDENQSNLIKVSKLKVFFLKYLPIALLLIFGSSFPSTVEELKLMVIALVIVAIGVIFYLSNIKYFKNYLILIVVGSVAFGYYDIFYNNMEFVPYVDLIWLYAFESILLFLFLVDIKNSFNYDFYKLKDIKNENKITVKTQRKKRPFLNFYFWKPKAFYFKSGFDSSFSFNFSMGGYYVRIPKDD